ncbi:MAG: hypothetical protein JWO38_6072 [Gemmataceae bacterium]|nr:hypothetical protein [Gemmataceae bacterium]
MSRHDDDDDRPRSRRRREDDDEEDRPSSRRGRAGDDDDRPRPHRRRDDEDDDYDFDHPRSAKKAKGGTPWAVIAVVLVVLLGGCGIGSFLLLFPAVKKAREAAGRAKDTTNLKQIGLGLHAYQDTNRALPPATGDLSWRVHILPYIEQNALYNRFDLTQPWDSPPNRNHADVVVPAYQSTLDGPNATSTRYRVFVGFGTIFEPGQPGMRFSEFKDGVSNTLLAVEAPEAVPWPQPRELPYTPSGPLPSVGHPDRNTVLVLMADGSVRSVDKKKMDPSLLRAIITPSGGEQVTPDW